MIQFLVTLTDDGDVQVHRTEGVPTQVSATFEQLVLSPGSSLDLHCKVQDLASLAEHARLIRLAVTDDAIPKFDSPAEADRWMEQRGVVIR